ncbi:hypothetical protein AAG906_008081 [Vitis piasezkii]
MKKKYQGSTRTKRQQLQALRSEFETLRMKPGESVSDYFSRTMAIINKMRIHGEKMEDVTVIEKILRSMTPKFNYVVCSIEESKDLDELSIDELQGSLLVHEQKIIQEDKEEQALKASTNNNALTMNRSADRGRGKGRGVRGVRDGGRGRGGRGNFRVDEDQPDFQNRGRGRNQQFDKSKVECFRCHKFGHYRSECYTKLPNDKEKGEKSNYAEKKEVETLLMAAQVNEQPQAEVWHVDTGYNNHVCGSKSSFCFLNEGFRSIVSFGDCSIVNVMGKGDINIRTKNGFVETISNVFYVPDLKSNLLSAGQLQEKGYIITIQKGACEIYDPLRGAIDVVQMASNRLFPLKIDSVQSFLMAESRRAKNVLELVHSDICGPINPTSNGGKKYLIIFIDDYSRKTWVSFCRKIKLLVHLKASRHALKRNRRSIKILKIDRGGEYCSNEFEHFVMIKAYKENSHCLYTTNEWCIGEKNRTILNIVRSLLVRGKIPKSFCPTFSAQNMTSEEGWSGWKLVVDHFKIFGCIAYAHVPTKRKKLDDKGEKCVFLGVSEASKAYKLFNPLTKKIVTSRDVIFYEESTWNWSGQQPTQVIFDNDAEEERQQLLQQQIPTVFIPESPPNDAPTATETSSTTTESNVVAESLLRRVRKRPTWMQDFEVIGVQSDNYDTIAHYALLSYCDPITFQEAIKDLKWHKAMNEEIGSIEKNNSWELVELPKGHKSIGVKWVYKTKLNKDGGVDKYKARLVAKGYKQEFGVDYKEVFPPVAKLDTIRLVLSMAAQNSWSIHQLDVKSAFLHGELEEEVYTDQPPGYVKQGYENQVYNTKSLVQQIDAYIIEEGFIKCPYEHTLYTKYGVDKKILIVCLYVDDLIYTSNNKTMLVDFKKSMMKEFDMTDMGLMHYFLGIEVVQSSAGVFISQKKYALEILDKFMLKDCNSVITPSEVGLKLSKSGAGKRVDSTLYKQIVGSLMYPTSTRPDIMHAINLIRDTWRIQQIKFDWFSDSDYARDLDDRNRLRSKVFMLNSSYYLVIKEATDCDFVNYGSTTSCDLCKDGVIDLVFRKSEDQIADILTKPLKPAVFMKLQVCLSLFFK